MELWYSTGTILSVASGSLGRPFSSLALFYLPVLSRLLGGWGVGDVGRGWGGAEDGLRLHTIWLLAGGVGGRQSGGKVVGGS